MTKIITFLLLFITVTGVSIAQPAAPTITGTTNYCEGQTIILTASSPAPGPIYTWTGPGIAGTYTGATLTIPGATIAMNGIYKATVTSGALTSAPSSVTIRINLKPAIPYASPDTITYCQGSNAGILKAIGANLLWYTTLTGGVGSPVPPTPATTVAGTFYYYVSQTINGCESDRKTITVNVTTKPGLPESPDVTYCQNAFAVPLHATGTNLLWYMSSSGGIGSSIAPTPVTSYAGIRYYYVTQTSKNCESDRKEVKVTVNVTPNALIVADAPYVCQHDTIGFNYFGNMGSSASYNWTMPPGASIVSGIGTGPIVVRFDQPGSQSIGLIVEYKGCKSPLTNYLVNVKQIPVVPVIIKPDACQNEVVNVSLGFANENIDQYNWNFDGAAVTYGSEGGPFGIKWSTSGMHTVSLTAVTDGCPSTTVVDKVTIHSSPDAHIGTVSDNNICAGDSVAFSAERYNAGNLYQWLPANYFGNVTNVPNVYGFVSHSGYVYLQVTSAYGCTATDSVLINAKACCEIYLPNAFTPNGDGKNDIFRPIGQGHQQIKTFRIMDRWGKVMFETVDPNDGWDGRTNGEVQDMGTYFYYIKYLCANGRTYEQKGELLLVR